MTSTPDPFFCDPRLAATYDAFEGPRDDLDHYERIVDDLGADVVLDVGCGTGELACRLARQGRTVIGVDPAAASVDIARRKPGAESVRWIVGTVDVVPERSVDLTTMTGNVAQVFVSDDDWGTAVASVARSLRSGGAFVFETRDPAQRAWDDWTPERTHASAELDDGDRATTWCVVTDVSLPFVTFRWTTVFESDGAELVSDSTLRFRNRDEIDTSLETAGFEILDIRDAPDRPGKEWVYVARKR
jgi:ubiquinone/menaquinone biosynthesis C-methylase UbiE